MKQEILGDRKRKRYDESLVDKVNEQVAKGIFKEKDTVEPVKEHVKPEEIKQEIKPVVAPVMNIKIPDHLRDAKISESGLCGTKIMNEWLHSQLKKGNWEHHQKFASMSDLYQEISRLHDLDELFSRTPLSIQSEKFFYELKNQKESCFRREFETGLVSSSFVLFTDFPKGKIIHYATLNDTETYKLSHKLGRLFGNVRGIEAVIPELPGELLYSSMNGAKIENFVNAGGEDFLQKLFSTNENAEDIIKRLEFISKMKRDKIYVERQTKEHRGLNWAPRFEYIKTYHQRGEPAIKTGFGIGCGMSHASYIRTVKK